ncbi:SDR family NAD(P)-dependent oxidoreductase [Spirosoma spitsbergense]|uniref:SDR family NAD(P)-dependent oxidoreductase n=1 Tax=Spirosoma spitsbergense TaxID=431554 RepID=UPI0003825D45|nr:SDR family NAD(P)-dependent oxidoreductase [Spirosoma spitsbergense]
MKKSIIIVGMGPGLSYGIAERFGREGFIVGMISRTVEKLETYQKQLAKQGIESVFATADVSNEAELVAALDSLTVQLGRVDVLQYNAVDYRMKFILDETIDDLTNGFRISVGNALLSVRHLLPKLTETGGAVLLTGGGSANYPSPEMGSISLGKAGIKNLAYQLNPALAEMGIFLGTVTVSGGISPDSPTHSPAILSEKFWALYQARNPVEVVY